MQLPNRRLRWLYGKMMQFFNSIRGKLIISFSVFMGIILIQIFTNFEIDDRMAEINTAIKTLIEIDRNIQEATRLEKDFFTDDITNPGFYETGVSEYLVQRKKILQGTRAMLLFLRHRKSEYKIIEGHDIRELLATFEQYEHAFEDLVVKMRERGFKSYGLVGENNKIFNFIDKKLSNVFGSELVELKSHEKDFFLAKDSMHLNQTIRIANQVSLLLEEVEEMEEQEKKNLQDLFRQYNENFYNIYLIEKEIGLDNIHGLRFKLGGLNEEISREINFMELKVETHAEDTEDLLRSISYYVMAISLGFGFWLSYFVSRSLGKPIRQLSQSIHRVIGHHFHPSYKIVRFETNDEVGMLSKDVSAMLDKVHKDIEELDRQKNDVINSKQTLLAGIEYAKEMQKAMMPNEADMGSFFSEHFVIYQPQQIASGDFYWLTKEGERTFLAVVDCTGHGVSGALMSMMGSMLLTKLILQSKIFEPALILEMLHVELREMLSRSGEIKEAEHQVKQEWMDVSICCIENCPEEPNAKDIHFAGAKQSCFFLHKEELHEIKGSKRSIGGIHRNTTIPFQAHKFRLEAGEVVYLLSDGIIDQNNTIRKKFGKNRLRKILDDSKHLTLSIQKSLLVKALEDFRDGEPLRDDITVIGVRV